MNTHQMAMLKSLYSSLAGANSFLLLIINTLFWSALVLPTAFLKAAIPHAGIRKGLSGAMDVYASCWAHCCCFILRIAKKIEWNAEELKNLNPDESYLMLCNHRSWADIFVLSHIFVWRIPFIKYFLKRELFWIPILGVVWWAMDFPFMKRYSRSFLQKHPELRGKDMETTREFCRKFKDSPVSVMNFLEGTRFNVQKRGRQNSPYRHLLTPKAGGVATALSGLGNYLSKIVDVTIVYPKNEPPVSFWDLLKGEVPSMIVRVKSMSVPEDFLNRNYQEDAIFRKDIQQWVNQRWLEKDELIENIMEAYPALPESEIASDDHRAV